MKKIKLFLNLFLILLAILMVFAVSASAVSTTDIDQDNFYQGKVVEWIVPWGAGGTTDVMTRTLAKQMEEKLGCTVVVKNVEGGGGVVGFKTLIDAEPDGYTLGSISPSMLLFKPTGKSDITYDEADFLFMAQTVPTGLFVPGDSPFETLKGLLAYAELHPGELRYANSGIGAIFHVVGETLASKEDVVFTPVPYDSGTLAATAAAGGHVEFAICAFGEAGPMLDSGDLKALAAFGDTRSTRYPEIPTTTELGIPGLLGTWTGGAAPAGIPDEARDLLMVTFEEIVEGEVFAEFTSKIGNQNYFMGGEEFTNFLEEQSKMFNEILAQ